MLLDPEIPLSGIQHKGISRNTKQLYAQIFKFSHLYTKKNWKCECSSVASGYVNCGMPICWAVKQLSSFRVWSTQEMLVFPFWKTKLRHKVKQYMQYCTCVALFYIDFVVMYMILKKWNFILLLVMCFKSFWIHFLSETCNHCSVKVQKCFWMPYTSILSLLYPIVSW